VETKTTDLDSLLEELDRGGGLPAAGQLAKVAVAVGKCFGVGPDEVAILALNAKQQNLSFVIPGQLRQVGTIPLSSNIALVARTVRERRAEVVNKFTSARHVSVFEGVPLGRQQGEYIQKIMSAPIIEGTEVVGVVQISRKGQTLSSAGPDFTQKDLTALRSLSPALMRFLRICRKIQ
jgi:hypothetical protein